MKREQPDHTGTVDFAAAADDGLAIPAWEIALTEVAQRFPALDADDYPSPLSVSVATFMRHLLDHGPGPESPSGDGSDRAAAIAGGIEVWLHRLAHAEDDEPTGFLYAEVRYVVQTKVEWGDVLQQVVEPLVRLETAWGARQWPTSLKDQVALLGEYLSKDPSVLPAVMAAVALGVPDPMTRVSPNQVGRRSQQVERLLSAYFNRLGRRSYCDFVHATAAECFSPHFRILMSAIVVTALRSMRSLEAAADAHVHEMTALASEHRRALAGKRVDVTALRREKEKAVTAARLDGVATSAKQVRLLETRVRELEAQLDTVRRRASRDKAYFDQHIGTVTADAPTEQGHAVQPLTASVTAPVSKRPIARKTPALRVASKDLAQARPLKGRRVFLYTNRQRGAAREAFVTELEHLGASEPRVYETKGASVPGPTAFPAQSVVIVDSSFMPHTFSNVIRRRARASHKTLFVEDHFGVGGLAERLARVIARNLSLLEPRRRR